MAASNDPQQVLDALRRIADPDRGSDLVSLGMVSGVAVRDGVVSFAIEVDPARGPQMEPVRRAAEEAVSRLPGIRSVRAVLTAHRPAAAEPPPAQRQAPRGAGLEVPGVKAIVAVASGKGGVGKSTVAANLAVAFAANGLAAGLLDADVYGPSMPRMMGLSRKPSSPDGKKIEPLEAHGIKVMSMGFLVAEDSPVIWRGPMVMSALEQMLRDVLWGDLDILVVDMPPGTGDAQLTLAQRAPLAGAVIVSTPQDVALADARKGLNMFRKVDVPVLGIVENMSYFACPHCGERTDIFGHGGAKAEAERLGVPFLGELPLDVKIRVTSDGGTPVTAAEPAGEHARIFRDIAARVWESIGGAPAGPRIVID